MDVTQTAIERPKKPEKILFRKKYHSLKMQMVINQDSQQIICLNFAGMAIISTYLKRA